MHALCRSAAILLALFLLHGCNSGPDLAEVYPVSGTVTGGSGSLEGAIIAFTPAESSGISSSGTIGADGEYTLSSSDGRTGAAVGRYTVTLALGPAMAQKAMGEMMAKANTGAPPRPGQSSGPPKMESPFPQKYSSATTSDKEVEVKAESNVIDIAL